ncbi:hypothetical protein [Legionella spiritensis]|uniref:Uncharacterized protein n=1 Tax=Legionella spiritensis TaxID=452 RepID=A0A0W0ZAM0_LEGSP|nr:hypothetical protein [Legionella spiritensis]KTD65994.1 hypothetical protein Lspi_0283 [Legionella spiritensis]SNV23483.1 Uncharacterised protein [Legionella spiritensis]
MKYIKDELLTDIPAAAKKLLKDDSLVESAEALDQMESHEKIALISEMIFQCDKNGLKDLVHSNESLRHHAESEDSFHALLSKGLEIGQRAQAMLDSRNKNPQQYLLGKEFNEGALFHQFHQLSCDLFNRDSKALATRLVLCTPEDRKTQRELLNNIRIVFEGSQFATDVGSAFELNRYLMKFTDDASIDDALSELENMKQLLVDFPGIVEGRLSGKESEIADRLMESKSYKPSAINRMLETVTSSAVEKDHPFRAISTCLGKLAEQRRETLKASNAPESTFFQSAELRARKSSKSSASEEDRLLEEDKDHKKTPGCLPCWPF